MSKYKTAFSVGFNDFAHLGALVENCVATRNPEDLEEGSILILHGGEDISPALYNQKCNKRTGAAHTPSPRDLLEVAMYKRAVELGMHILGICRGAQLACVLNGGSLIQHVNNHTGGPHMLFLDDTTVMPTNSCHHQMMFPKGDFKLLGWSKSLSDVYYGETDDIKYKVKEEPEIVEFPKTKTLAIQGHPEWLTWGHPLVKYMINWFEEQHGT